MDLEMWTPLYNSSSGCSNVSHQYNHLNTGTRVCWAIDNKFKVESEAVFFLQQPSVNAIFLRFQYNDCLLFFD